MPLVQKNVKFRPYQKTSSWRKIAMGTWWTCGDPSVYTLVDIDCSTMLSTIEQFKKQGLRLTPTAIVARGVALCLGQYPQINSVIRFGRLYLRETVDIFLQVSPGEDVDNLTGMVIREMDKKNLEQVNHEIGQKAQRIKKDRQEDFQKVKKSLDSFPGLLMRPLLRLLSFLNYDLNCWSPLLMSPRDSFGSAMVTSVGMLDIDNALVPLIPHSRCPLLVSVGKIVDRPVVLDGQIGIRPMMTLGITYDHRHMDGHLGAKMLKMLKEYLSAPY